MSSVGITSRFGFSENEMAVAFSEALCSRRGPLGLGHFAQVYCEIDCMQGRPDFIAFKMPRKLSLPKISGSIGVSGAHVLAMLHLEAPRKLEYLLQKLPYSTSTSRNKIGFLKTIGLVRETKIGTFRLTRAAANMLAECWAFELKLAKPKRALFQAKQMRMFAHNVVIVVPPSQVRNYDKFSRAMKTWGIGLASFDPIDKHFELFCRPRKQRPLSKKHQFYAVAQSLSCGSTFKGG